LEKGHVRRVFAAAHTARGYRTLIRWALPEAGVRLFVVDGPGRRARSQALHGLAAELVERGVEVVALHDPLDPGQLEGLVVPAASAAAVARPASHPLEAARGRPPEGTVCAGEAIRAEDSPAAPEARSGDGGPPDDPWNRVVWHQRRGRRCLEEARLAAWEAASYLREAGALDVARLARATRELVRQVFGGAAAIGRARQGHLFASAVTGEGPRHYFESVFGPAVRRVVVRGEPGTGQRTLLRAVYRGAVARGFDVEVYRCALDPRWVDHVYVPQLGVAVVSSREPHTYEPKTSDVVVDTGLFVLPRRLAPYRDDVAAARERFRERLARAALHLSRARGERARWEDAEGPQHREVGFDLGRLAERILAGGAEARTALPVGATLA
jgi:hypothetical protein